VSWAYTQILTRGIATPPAIAIDAVSCSIAGA